MSGLLTLAFLLGIGLGVGALLVPARPARWPRTGWLSLTALAGLLLVATVANGLGVFGVPLLGVQLIAWGAAAFGWFTMLRRPGTPCLVPLRDEGLVLLLVAFLTFVPWAGCAGGLVHMHDTAVIWYPKILEIESGVVPTVAQIGAAWPTQGHAEYPRGLSWLAVLGDPAQRAEPSLPQFVSLLFTTLGALLLAGWFLARRRPSWAALSALLFLCLPEVAYQMALGMADLPLAIAILVAVLGLAWARGSDPDVAGLGSQRCGRLLAATAAAGAASFKQEGAIIAGAVGIWACVGLLRGPRGERRHWLLCLAVLATILPWWELRTHLEGEVLRDVGILTHPTFALERIALLADKVYFQMVDLRRFDPDNLGTIRTPVAGWVLLAGLVSLLLFRRRPVPFWPATLLLLADLAIYSVTFHDLTWHLRTSAERLWMQLAPALILAVLAAAERARSAELPAAPPPAPARPKPEA